jgi:hypothetical protein
MSPPIDPNSSTLPTLVPLTQVVDVRLYVLVNKDLPTIHGGIQGAHAVAELMSDYPEETSDWAKNHKTLVFLAASEEQIREMNVYFTNKKRPYAQFLEPDLDNLLTAAAYEPMHSFEGKVIFGKFKLFS